MEEELPRYYEYKGRTIDRGKYLIRDPKDGRLYRVHYIGPHHTAFGSYCGGVTSSYNGKLEEDDEVNIESGIGDIRMATVGDIREAYEILKEVIKERQPSTVLEKCECVMETVTKYFGDYSNIENRLSFFPDEDMIDYYKMKHGTLADIAHKNAAICVERSMLSQNLLKTIGIDTTFKMGGFINNDGKPDGHAFNVINDNGRYYIYDSTQPTLRNGIVSPIVAEIPKEVYEAVIEPRSENGISIRVSHYNPLMNKDYDVIYDAGWKRSYDARNSLEDQKRV